jgi:hypothetical protein
LIEVIVSAARNCVQEHQVIKVGDFSTLLKFLLLASFYNDAYPFFRHITSLEQLSRQHQRSFAALWQSILYAYSDSWQMLDNLLDDLLIRKCKHDCR